MIWFYTSISVLVVSLISLIGVFTLSMDKNKLAKFLIYFVSLSAGTLLGDAFIHLIPQAYASTISRINISFCLLAGITVFFVMEKFVHWRHCHEVPCEEHPHPFSYVILFGDAIHNFIDGMVIAASFLVSFPIGIATTTAVIFHEIPHEMGNFGSLVYGGFSRAKALAFNFLSAITSFLGAFFVLLISTDTSKISEILVPFAAGGFIYIATADLIPELHKNTEIKKSVGQFAFFLAGIGLMLLLVFFE